MSFNPKVKESNCCADSRTSYRGEFTPGKLPRGGYNPVWNFKNNQPNDWDTRKESPTSGGGKKVY
jgi:hypothetical protein